MDKFIKYAEEQGCEFVEIKGDKILSNSISLENNEVKELATKQSNLFSVRVLHQHKLGLASSNKSDIKLLVDQAIACAKVNDQVIDLSYISDLKGVVTTKFKINPRSIDLEEKKKKLLNLAKLKKIQSLNLTYRDTSREYNLINCFGCDLKFNDVSTTFIAIAFAKKNNLIEQAWKIERNHIGYELMEKAENVVKKVMTTASSLLEAKQAKGGNFPVIADQKLGGVFCHEAVGHACEADAILQKNSVFQNKLNKMVANEKLSISDNGTIISNGWVPFDDDGNRGRKTLLIKKGILTNYLHSLETASIMKVQPTGNGRAQDLSSRVIPRMTATYIENGDSKFEEMIQEVKNGYYLKNSAGGQVNPTNVEFLFNSVYGYKIEGGELKEMVKKVSLTGIILDILPKICLIAKDLKLGSGSCGKSGQLVPVADGSPHILIESAKVGGAA